MITLIFDNFAPAYRVPKGRHTPAQGETLWFECDTVKPCGLDIGMLFRAGAVIPVGSGAV